MDKKTTGGPAFPESYGDPRNHWIEGGMTLRDYFAAKAMQALITAKSKNMSLDSSGWPIFAETDAWMIADAMLSERKNEHLQPNGRDGIPCQDGTQRQECRHRPEQAVLPQVRQGQGHHRGQAYPWHIAPQPECFYLRRM